MGGLNDFIKKAQESSLVPSLVTKRWKAWVMNQGESCHQNLLSP